MSETAEKKTEYTVMRSEYHNALTADLDQHLKKSWKRFQEYAGGSYFYLESTREGYLLKKENQKVYYIAIRYPGATRGCIGIERDTGRIVHFEFNETAYEQKGIACYDPSVVEVRTKWMGTCLLDLLKIIEGTPDCGIWERDTTCQNS
ncbi:MAG: hypothetical protein NC489_08815 [Ruminococcus flavefaciens]|nr:hypothetical protein [Ruminococcus flavefaciens]